jgi:hypothetical protein
MFSLPRVNKGVVTRINHLIGELIGSDESVSELPQRRLALICRVAANSMVWGAERELNQSKATR